MKKNRGFTLVEALIAAALLVFLVSSVVLLFKMLSISMVQTKDKMRTQKLGEMGFSRIGRMPFWEIVPLDSDLPGYGYAGASFDYPDGTHTGHPSEALLDNFMAAIEQDGFDRFTVDVTYYRRDTTGVQNSSGTALMPFTPSSDPNIDLYDNDVRFFDFNNDTDNLDVYVSTRGFPYANEWVSEVPNTHIREVRLSLWRNGVVVSSSAKMFNLGALSGDRRTSSEALLRLIISTPTNNQVLYQSTSSAQTAALGVSISSSYPSYFSVMRADSGQTMELSGWTTPYAKVSLYDIDGNDISNFDADSAGTFNELPTALQSTLREGNNFFVAIAQKGIFQSANNVRTILLDVNPPSIDSITPAAATVATKTPWVSARIRDLPTGGFGVVEPSGIQEETIKLEVSVEGGAFTDADYRYDSDTGILYWVENSTSLVPPTLSTETTNNDYTMRLSFGDKAGYKAKTTWSFEVSIATGDTTAPDIDEANCEALNSLQIRVKVTDPESGVRPDSIIMTVAGLTVVDASNIGSSYDPETGWVTYTASTPMTSGSNPPVTLQATHWGENELVGLETCSPAVEIP